VPDFTTVLQEQWGMLWCCWGMWGHSVDMRRFGNWWQLRRLGRSSDWFTRRRRRRRRLIQWKLACTLKNRYQVVHLVSAKNQTDGIWPSSSNCVSQSLALQSTQTQHMNFICLFLFSTTCFSYIYILTFIR